ncbi:TPA: helix-turn-helix transcriptional regulator [Escherichia coli]|uniref:helix-turn-helix domain-containing protein n=1 Tax=Escherichia coli TaxID=562 RepID=UPI00045B23DC|nr:helix-turn-helix transcriptional regulator [Escherichia coli]EFA4168161.1 helix-turn-helix transcriptional regulator [Escherichia coli O80:H45]EEW1718223.1 XRE family transcriptional regulator [Escherichia coli]EFC1507246.1 XRE family transcriptional regulator [Escherichia coli]EFH3055941.1 helix-turn-helix domain-containing protein [Escherichia coli]EFH4381471.1 helix-turn-helix domain-containing protein [Escherichia coli]
MKKNNELHHWEDVKTELLKDEATANVLDVVVQRKAVLSQLVEKRKALNLSQTAVAKQLGVTRQAVSKFEKGESSPTLDVVFSYANAIGIDLFGSLKRLIV